MTHLCIAPSQQNLHVSDSLLCSSLQKNWPALRRRARHLSMGDQALADDLLAEASLKLLLYKRKHQVDNGDLTGLLFVVLNHVFLDKLRRERREQQFIEYSDFSENDVAMKQIGTQTDSSERLELGQSLEQIYQAFELLSAEQQQLFRLKFEQNLSYAMIAEQLGINQALARKRVEILRRRLRHLSEL